MCTIEKEALIFNEFPFARSYFTSKSGNAVSVNIRLENEQIQLLCLKRHEDGYLMRLYNSSPEDQKTRFTFINTEIMVDFSPFEIRAFYYMDGCLSESQIIRLKSDCNGKYD